MKRERRELQTRAKLGKALRSCCLYFTIISANFAQTVPQLINYQGKLTDANGLELATANYDLAFSVYASLNGADRLWGPQTIKGTPLVKGNFNVILGPRDDRQNSLLSAFDGGDRWVEVTVGTNTISPRQQILSAPFAMKAQMAFGLVPGATMSAPAGGADLLVATASSANQARLILQSGAAHAYIGFGGGNYRDWGGPNSLNVVNQSDGPITFNQSINDSTHELMRVSGNGDLEVTGNLRIQGGAQIGGSITGDAATALYSRLTALEQKVQTLEAKAADLQDQLNKANGRISGIKLEAPEFAVTQSFSCGGQSIVGDGPDLWVMYGSRDGTSCGVQNVNWYKRLRLTVP